MQIRAEGTFPAKTDLECSVSATVVWNYRNMWGLEGTEKEGVRYHVRSKFSPCSEK